MKYTTINILGNLISEEILQKIERAEADGQLAKDYGLESGANLRSEIEYAWSRIKLDWKHFSDRSQKLPANDPYGTTLSRKWMEQFLHSLGFETTRQRNALQGSNNHQYAISHTADNLDSLPLHIVGFLEPGNSDKNTLDVKSSGGTSRFSPHATMQEYLNVTEHVYGIASNGLYLRLLRDSGRLIKLTYLEFDLKRMLDEDKYSEFTLLYRLLHASRFPRGNGETEQCYLDKYYQDSIETGNRIRDGLSLAVKESLVALGKGFLQHEQNEMLRNKIQSGQLSPKDYYRQLLRIIYRLLFLMVTEERDLMYDPEDETEATQRYKKLYWRFYSIARLRKLSENRYLYESQFTDLWKGLVQSFKLFEAAGKGKKMGIQPLDGDLFSEEAIADLQYSIINNQLFLECIHNLNEFEDKQSKALVPINYRSLDVEELGSVYEGLLELYPVIENIETGILAYINFTFHEGTDRKTTGSYYTRPDLVNELIKSALIPVIVERLNEHSGNKQAQSKSLLSLKVCDAAAGSGHMLLAAARTIAWYLARVESGEDNPGPSVFRSCLREVIQHCVYGVDMNPDAVELCKLALWLESHNSGKPLSFLDHKIRCGNSLVGVSDLSVLNKGIPDEAFRAVTSDDKEVCKELKKVNLTFNKTRQTNLFDQQTAEIEANEFSTEYHDLDNIKQDDVEGVHKAKNKFEILRTNIKWWKDWRACNLWTAAFFFNYTEENKLAAPNSERLQKFLQNPEAAYGPMIGKANAMSVENRFFHWPLEFPDVFKQGGFDVILGNPPWEIVELSEKEFFSTINKEIATADTSATRRHLIDVLKGSDPKLYNEFIQRKHNTDSQRRFIQFSKRYPDSSKGRIDLYPLFLENSFVILSKTGICSLILPSSIAMGAYNADLFSKIVNENRLRSFFDFENSKGIFPDVHRSYRICLITFTGGVVKNSSIELLYHGKQVSDLLNEIKRIKLSKGELEMFSPNTLAPPIILTKNDLLLAKKVYSTFGVLNNRKGETNKWGVIIRRMLSLSDGDDLFKKSYDLNEIKKANKAEWIKLYSGKAIYQYDHRFASYKNKKWENTTEKEYKESEHQTVTEYYAKAEEVLKRTNSLMPHRYLIGFRDIARSTDERTCIASIVPRVGCDSHCRNIYFENGSNILILFFLGNINSIVFDYFVRQKVIGTGLGSGTFEQLPVLAPNAFGTERESFIIPKILELTYSSWDIKSFADDIWKEADGELKSILKKQWEENETATDGHEWNPPDWCEIDEMGCPLPPFKWDEDRRAVLKGELDAMYAKLYSLTTEELRYILDPQEVYGPDFPGETFRVLKEKEIRQYGEYRTRRLVLEAWERLNSSEKLYTVSQEPPIPQPISVDLKDISTAMKEWTLHDGIYNIQDCARITRLSADKIRRWFGELYKEKYEGFGDHRKADVSNLRISFHGMIELVVIGTLRDNGLTLKKILAARKDLKSKTRKEYPFATNNVRDHLNISGSDIIFQFPEGLVTLNGSGQINLDFIKTFFKDIHFNMDGIAISLMPEKGRGKISINPKEANGKPAVIQKEVPVDAILQFYTGKDSVKKIQEQFNLEEDEVLAAIEYGN